jgi:hypothetical protein
MPSYEQNSWEGSLTTDPVTLNFPENVRGVHVMNDGGDSAADVLVQLPDKGTEWMTVKGTDIDELWSDKNARFGSVKLKTASGSTAVRVRAVGF